MFQAAGADAELPHTIFSALAPLKRSVRPGLNGAGVWSPVLQGTGAVGTWFRPPLGSLVPGAPCTTPGLGAGLMLSHLWAPPASLPACVSSVRPGSVHLSPQMATLGKKPTQTKAVDAGSWGAGYPQCGLGVGVGSR